MLLTKLLHSSHSSPLSSKRGAWGGFGILFMLMLLPVKGNAQMTATLSSGQGHPGDEVQFSLSLSGSSAVTAVEVNIPLTETLSYVEGSAAASSQRLTANHELAVSQSNGLLKLYIYSTSLDLLKGTSGELLHFKLKLGNEPGTISLNPALVLSDTQGKPVGCSVTSGSVTILSPKASIADSRIDFGRVPIRSTYTKPVSVTNTGNEPLTVNGFDCTSERFSVSPQTATIAAGKTSSFTLTYAPLQYGEEQATVSMRSNAVNGTQTITVVAQPYSVNSLSVSGATGSLGEEVTIGVSMQNMEAIVAAQCCFELPEALEFVAGSDALESSRSDGHQLTATVNGRRLSFFIHSEKNNPLKGSDGQLFSFRLKLIGTGGTYPLRPQDVILSNSDGADMTSGSTGADVRIASPKAEGAATLNFGRMPMEQPVVAKYTLRNAGELPLVVQRVEFTSDAFSLNGSLPTIDAGAEVTLVVSYQSAEEGDFEGTMQIYTNDPDNRMMAVAMRGTAYITNELSLAGRPVAGNKTQYIIDVDLQNSLPIVGMQFDIHWLEEMTTSQEAIQFSDRANDHKAVLTKLSEGNYRVYVYSEHNTPITKGQGTVVSVIYNNVRANNNYMGTTVTIDNVLLSTADAANCASADRAELLVVGAVGDVNGDGVISIADVIATAAFYLGRTPEGGDREQADANRDGQVTDADVEIVAKMLMKQKY